MNFGLALILLLVCYVLVTLAGMIHTVINWKVFKINGNNDLGNSDSTKPKATTSKAYKATEPFHPLYNVILFPIFAYFYLHTVSPWSLYKEATILGLCWTVVSIIIDLIGWVLIPHPWSMTFKEMYIDYQPWITLIYIAIFVSPLIASLIIRY